MAGSQTTTAVINAPSRKLFRPMFRARWQNMQNIISDSAFIDMIPEPYVSYYIAFIQQCLQWSRGFVPMLHRSDFFSTGMGYTVCEIFARECTSGGFRIESVNKELQAFMEQWSKNDNFTEDLSRLFFDTNAGGNALLVLTPVNGDAYVSVYPVNRCFFQIGRNGKVSKATLLNRFTAGETAYYAKEIRLYLNGKAYYKVRLGKGTLVVSPTWNSSTFQEVPDEIQTQWEFNYGDIKPETWYELPFASIGIYNVPNKPLAASVADLPGYSDSTLYTALDVLYSIDYNYTQAQVDMYFGKSRALVPKQMQTGAIHTGALSRSQIGPDGERVIGVNVAEGLSLGEVLQSVPLDDQFYTEVRSNGVDGKPIQPTLLQPDLRGEAHKYIRDADLELLASKVGLSSSTLANHLTNNKQKTNDEINAEQDTTTSSVEMKRKLATTPINDLLTDVAKFYGFTDSVEIVWGRTNINTASQNRQLLEEYQAGALPLREYLKRRYSDLSNEEVEEWAQEIETKEKEKQSAQNQFGNSLWNDKDYYGGNPVGGE